MLFAAASKGRMFLVVCLVVLMLLRFLPAAHQGISTDNDKDPAPEKGENMIQEIKYPEGMNVVNNTGCVLKNDTVEIPHIIHQSWKDNNLPLVLMNNDRNIINGSPPGDLCIVTGSTGYGPTTTTSSSSKKATRGS